MQQLIENRIFYFDKKKKNKYLYTYKLLRKTLDGEWQQTL